MLHPLSPCPASGLPAVQPPKRQNARQMSRTALEATMGLAWTAPFIQEAHMHAQKGIRLDSGRLLDKPRPPPVGDGKMG